MRAHWIGGKFFVLQFVDQVRAARHIFVVWEYTSSIDFASDVYNL